MNICIIPARGGSKRIPRKNIRKFCGKPMIAWSIKAAQESGCFEQIVVSTDDFEIAEIAKHWGAEVPFIRPSSLAGDLTATIPVILHALEWIQAQGTTPKAVCCLYATAPFVQPSEIKQGVKLLQETDNQHFSFTATSYSSPIQRALRLTDKNDTASMWQPEYFNKRSQDLETAYHDAGQFYWGRPQAWLQTKNIFEGSRPVILPRWRVQDIDTEEDWFRAEIMHQLLVQQKLINV